MADIMEPPAAATSYGRNPAMTSNDRPWSDNPHHQRWLLGQADDLLAFFERRSMDPSGGFHTLDDRGDPTGDPLRELHSVTRMVHCFAIAHLMGRPGADRFIDHGMDFLWNVHRDGAHGGYFWSVEDGRPADDRKQAYGHAFVLLAASSAQVIGHPDARRLLDDMTSVIAERFWESRHGATAEEFARDWSPISAYRGQNSNMHLTEALMAAFEATGERTYLDMAGGIAEHLIRDITPANGGYLPEHFDTDWNLDREYANGDHFRPYGTTPGHWVEWTRLCLLLWELGDRSADWIPPAARGLFDRAVAEAWSTDGGFLYTLDWNGQPRLTNRLWWPCAEAIGAAYFLTAATGDGVYETWYRRIWDFVACDLIDREHGGWRTEPADQTNPLFTGKPDLYHALQACLIPLLPTDGTVTRGLLRR